MAEESTLPLPYEEWLPTPGGREYGAAYTFGYDLMRYCRAEALKAAFAKLPSDSDARPIVEEAVDIALHNVVDLLEGFFPMQSGPNHPVEYKLTVVVRNAEGQIVEEVAISPTLMDLPIGYWKWRDGGFR
jgi:hypothetical protein